LTNFFQETSPEKRPLSALKSRRARYRRSDLIRKNRSTRPTPTTTNTLIVSKEREEITQNSASTVMVMDSYDEDYLLEQINNFSEAEMRLLLQHISLVHPEVVRAALVHVTYDVEDIASVTTAPVNNTTTNRMTSVVEDVPVRPGEHPSKRNPGEAESDDDAMPPPSMPRSNSSFPYPHAYAPTRKNKEEETSDTGVRLPARRRHSASSSFSSINSSFISTTTTVREFNHDNSDDSGILPSKSADSQLSTGTAAASGICYLRYDLNAGGKLIIEYSKSTTAPSNALAQWTPQSPHSISPFKFSGHATSELIGNCSAGLQGRKNYYRGWCQFVRLAKLLNGFVTMLNGAETEGGIGVDIFAYVNQAKGNTTLKLAKSFSTIHLMAIACLPRHTDFYQDMRIDLTKWMTEAATIGSATFLENNGNAPAAPPLYESPLSGIRRLAPPQPPKGVTPPLSRTLRSASNSGAPLPPIPSTNSAASAKGVCYLFYNSDSAKLMLQYTKSALAPPNALAQWTPGANNRIQGFKFTQNHGRAELIGNCASGVAGRKNYYSGCCQFIKYAQAMQGTVTFHEHSKATPGLPMDMYLYCDTKNQTQFLQSGQAYNLAQLDGNHKLLAVACLPKHSKFYSNYMSVDLTKWTTEAATQGAASQF